MNSPLSIICAIVKNEQLFIHEWVSYYISIGFCKLYIFEDYGSDTHKYQLEDFIADGKVELISLTETEFVPHYKGTLVQNRLYDKFFHLCKDGEIKADWVGFFDVDEFLAFEDGWNLSRLEDDFKDTAGVILAWKLFGANGHIERPKGNVVDNYTTYMPLGTEIDVHKYNVKSLVNIKNCDKMRHIHIFEGCLNTDHTDEDKMVFNKAWLNHYFTKSWEDYLDRIFSRGNMQNNYRCLDGFFVCNPDMLDKEKELIFNMRNKHTKSTMWISRKYKLISGGNLERIKELRNKYLI